MQYVDRRAIAAALIVVGPQLAACQQQAGHTKIEPALVENIDGSDVSQVTLTEKAMERIALQTSVVREEQVVGYGGGTAMRKVVPYSALIYDPNGETWVYISPEPRRFVRHPVKVERIVGDDAVLFAGPDKDTQVATVGAAELYGAESGVGH